MNMVFQSTAIFCCLLLCLAAEAPRGNTANDIAGGTPDGAEKWGYVAVRPKAFMFWAYYKSPNRSSTPGKPWPTLIWLHGGPGGSGVGQGNFEEVGPIDVNLRPRNSTWLQKADIIFVDSPVGVGYSYVEHPSALASTDEQVTMDLVKLIKALTTEIPTLQSSPLRLVGVSYGGKHAGMVGAALGRSIHAGSLNLTFMGIVIGGGWISPPDFVLSFPPLLHIMSRLDDNAVPEAIRLAVEIQHHVAAENYSAAYKTFQDLMEHINLRSGEVNFEDIMIDATQTEATSLPSDLSCLMNGVMRKKYKIIPENVTWPGSLAVFDALTPEFMRPRINEVDELLSYGYQVAVYSGQFDLICSTIGAEAWLRKLKWDGLQKFLSLDRDGIYCCAPYKNTNVFKRSYKNLSFYWVLEAGHRVPVDQPCSALEVIGDILKS